MTTSPPLANGKSVMCLTSGSKRRTKRGESATTVEERGSWPEIGAVVQKERSVQSVEGMDILLCAVVVRGIVM